jgi:hypothetical protein
VYADSISVTGSCPTELCYVKLVNQVVDGRDAETPMDRTLFPLKPRDWDQMKITYLCLRKMAFGPLKLAC